MSDGAGASQPAVLRRGGLWRALAAVMGRGGMRWFGLVLASAAALSATDAAVAALIYAVLQELGLSVGESGNAALALLDDLELGAIVALLLAVGALRATAQLGATWSRAAAREHVLTRLRVQGLRRHGQGGRAPSISTVALQQDLHEIHPAASWAVAFASDAVGRAIYCGLLLALMVAAAPRETAAALLGATLAGGPAIWAARRGEIAGGAVMREHRRLLSRVQRLSRNWLLLRVLRTAGDEEVAVEAHIARYGALSMRRDWLVGVAAATPSFAGPVVVVIVLWLGISVWQTPGTALIAFFYLLLRFIGGLVSAARGLAHLQARKAQVVAAARSIEPAGMPSPRTAEPAGAPTPGVVRAPSVELRAASFAWPGATQPAVAALQGRFGAGEVVGVAGPSGSGKSTLLALLAGILEPAEGDVLLADEPASAWAARAGRRMGYVGAEPFLIDGTVRDNLRYGHDPARAVTDDDVFAALAAVGLADRVRALDGGLDHRLAPEDPPLSTGEQQRLCCARAVLAQPALLLCDEPTANLDTASEQLVVDLLTAQRGRSTVVVASHRRPVLERCDAVLTLG